MHTNVKFDPISIYERILPDGCCVFDSIEVLAIASQQLFNGHCGFFVEQSGLFRLH